MEKIRFIDKYPNEEVKALSWKQPFGMLMLHGKKETRSRNTTYRGWVLMCASQLGYTQNKLEEIAGEEQISRINTFHQEPIIYGHAFAIGYLKYVSFMGNYSGKKAVKELEDQTFVKYNPELYIYQFTEVQRIEPFPWKGTQGWTTLNEEQKSKIIIL